MSGTALAACVRRGLEQAWLRHRLMACCFGQQLFACLFRLWLARFARLGGAGLLTIAYRLVSRLRIARFLALPIARLLSVTSRLGAGGCVAVAFLPVLRTRRARCFGRDVGRRHETVDRHFLDLMFDQTLDVLQVLQLFAVHQ